VFEWLQRLGGVEEAEMFRVFNMGVGLALVVSEYYAESIVQQVRGLGMESWRIGRVVEGTGEARWG
jgi:phosphoribosylformylglycinamidine cyclo-ligase